MPVHRWKYTTIVKADEAEEEWELFKADVMEAFGGLPSDLIILNRSGGFEIHLDNVSKLFSKDKNNLWLQFNGVGDNSEQTFVLFGCKTIGTFSRCDTGFRPYDLFVRVCLILAYHHGLIRSDVSPDCGSRSDWEDARDVISEQLGDDRLTLKRN